MPKRRIEDSEDQQEPKQVSKAAKKRKIKVKVKEKTTKTRSDRKPASVSAPSKTPVEESVVLVVSIPKSQISIPKRSRGLSITSNGVQTTAGNVPSPISSGGLPLNHVNQPSFPNGTHRLKFKNKNFQSSGASVGKKRIWKNLKQIVSQIKAENHKPSDPTYVSIEAPPSLLPAKKYSDISGLHANYTDPLTGLHYSSVEEFCLLRNLPPTMVQSHLSLRKAGHSIV